MAAVWLTCQVAAFAAAPLIVCNDHNVMSRMDEAKACEHHHHHETTTTTSDDAALKCRCTVSDAALAALTLEAGILPGELVLETRPATRPVVLTGYAAPTRSQHPDIPPPRA